LRKKKEGIFMCKCAVLFLFLFLFAGCKRDLAYIQCSDVQLERVIKEVEVCTGGIASVFRYEDCFYQAKKSICSTTNEGLKK